MRFLACYLCGLIILVPGCISGQRRTEPIAACAVSAATGDMRPGTYLVIPSEQGSTVLQVRGVILLSPIVVLETKDSSVWAAYVPVESILVGEAPPPRRFVIGAAADRRFATQAEALAAIRDGTAEVGFGEMCVPLPDDVSAAGWSQCLPDNAQSEDAHYEKLPNGWRLRIDPIALLAPLSTERPASGFDSRCLFPALRHPEQLERNTILIRQSSGGEVEAMRVQGLVHATPCYSVFDTDGKFLERYSARQLASVFGSSDVDCSRVACVTGPVCRTQFDSVRTAAIGFGEGVSASWSDFIACWALPEYPTTNFVALISTQDSSVPDALSKDR